MLIHKGL